ncbi:MAG: GntR family transcriptional regulator [Anaerolineae bacterium]|nr:GntR family transcriptional regulator [Anaerolineae bacterium]
MNHLKDKIKLDFRSDEPLYMQLVRQVEQLVLTGELNQGDQLPTVRELATELRINFNTVARAYRLLDEARLISTQRGRGTYIWEEPTRETVERLRQISLAELARRYLDEAAGLGYDAPAALDAVRDNMKPGNPEHEDVGADQAIEVKNEQTQQTQRRTSGE